MLRKLNRIIAKIKSSYWRISHKYGIRLPPEQIDKEMGTDFWEKALAKKMTNMQVTWKAKEVITPVDVETGRVPDMIGYKKIKCHIIFDIKYIL